MLHLHLCDPPIIHRDLKSPNLLVDKHWKLKVPPRTCTTKACCCPLPANCGACTIPFGTHQLCPNHRGAVLSHAVRRLLQTCSAKPRPPSCAWQANLELSIS